jgi:hypothetical protein
MPKKLTTVRLREDQAQALELFAEVDGVAVAVAMRSAVDLLIAQRQSDPAFRARVEAAIARAQATLLRLDEPLIAAALAPSH